MRCEKCSKEGAYLRMKTKEVVCRNCGAIYKKKGARDVKTMDTKDEA